MLEYSVSIPFEPLLDPPTGNVVFLLFARNGNKDTTAIQRNGYVRLKSIGPLRSETPHLSRQASRDRVLALDAGQFCHLSRDPSPNLCRGRGIFDPIDGEARKNRARNWNSERGSDFLQTFLR